MLSPHVDHARSVVSDAACHAAGGRLRQHAGRAKHMGISQTRGRHCVNDGESLLLKLLKLAVVTTSKVCRWLTEVGFQQVFKMQP